MNAAKSLPMFSFKSAYTVALVSLMLLASTATEAAESKDCTLTQPPTTPVELIQNIQCAVAKNILFDDDIFTNDEKVWKIFAGRGFQKNYPYSGNVKTVALSDFPNELDTANLKALPLWQRMFITISQSNSENAKEEAYLTLSGGEGLQLDFDEVVKLFGPHWKRVEEIHVDSSAQDSSSPGKVATHIKRKLIPAYAIEYKLPAPPPVSAGILIHFDSGGYLQDFMISSERK